MTAGIAIVNSISECRSGAARCLSSLTRAAPHHAAGLSENPAALALGTFKPIPRRSRRMRDSASRRIDRGSVDATAQRA
jgi:hypothetical protein